jgi:hypothetical protein
VSPAAQRARAVAAHARAVAARTHAAVASPWHGVAGRRESGTPPAWRAAMLPRRLLRTSLAAAVLAAVVATGGEARADKAAAEALFQEGRRLMEAKDYAAACPKLAESHRLDPGIGVLLYLGDCYAANGQTASAWAAFREAEPAARAAGQADRARIAADKIAALEPKLSRILLVPPAGVDPTSFEVRLDRDVFGAATLGVGVPIDPGSHQVEVSAPGKVPWSSTIEVRAAAPETRIELPVLQTAAGAAAPVAGATSTPPDAEESGWNGQKTAAVVVGGVGVGAVVVGSVFGAMAFSTWASAEDNCLEGEPRRCTAQGVDDADSASTQGTVSTVAYAVGGAAIVGAAVLWLTAPDGSDATTGRRASGRHGRVLGGFEVVPHVDLASGGATVRRSF